MISTTTTSRLHGRRVVAAGASHVGAWFLNPATTPLDANQQVLQNQEVAYVTTFARTGKPTAERGARLEAV